MKNLLPVYIRECRSYFSGPVAWFVTVIFLVIAGVFFLLIMNDYTQISFEVIRANYQINIDQLNVTDGILSPLFRTVSFIMLLMVPLLTMRSFADEKKTGTLELLFTWPVTDLELVMGKALAVLTVLASMIGLSFLYCLLVLWFLPLPAGPTFTGFLGLLLLGSAFTSVGVFISSLTENQVISAAWSFGMIMIFWIIGWIPGDSDMPVAEIIRYFSLFEHFESFATGVLDSRDIFYYLSVTFFFGFLTLRSLESRRYRG